MSPLRPGRSLAKRPLAALASLACALLLAALPARQAAAATTVSLFKSFAGNINFVTTGNTLRNSPNTTYGGNPCTVISGNNGNSVNAGSSSSPVSGIPAGSTIVAAYLYYAASGTTVDSTVTFNGSNVTASRTFTDTTNSTGDEFFSGFVDVTSLVTGNGTYSFSNLNINDNTTSDYCARSTVLAGWALVVIYSNNTTEGSRVINVYDGFEPFSGDSITLTPANFQVPATGINGKFAVITWEGDPDINSTNGTTNNTETLEFNGNVLSDACNPTADTSLPNGSNGGAFVSGNPNQYNSTINTLTCTGNATTDDVYYGVDIDTFTVNSYLTAGETSATTFYSSGQDLVFLSAQVISVSNTPVGDLSITKTHSGTFGYGDVGTYTLTVTNNGPATETGTVTVTDTLPTGETFSSGTGTGWTCSAAAQVVTCTNPSTGGIASGSSFPAISLNVNVLTTAGTSLSNTATVASTQFDNNSGNNTSAADVVTPVHPDLSTSTKTVLNPTGGDYTVGGTVQYTITLTESNGVQASGVSVVDNIPADMTGLTVTSFPSGATNSTTTTGGTNGDGQLNITGISVPANGSVTIVFTAQITSPATACTDINNTATVTNPGGATGNTSNTLTAPTVIVAQSACASSGNKILYVYDAGTLTRTVQPATNTTGLTITGNNAGTATGTWTLTPNVAAGKTLVIPAQNISISLICQATNLNTGTNRPVSVQLLNGATSMGTAGPVNCRNGPVVLPFTITTTGTTTVAAGSAIKLVVTNGIKATNNNIAIIQYNGGVTPKFSSITFGTSTVINVDSVTAYNSTYTGTSTPGTTTVYQPSETGKTVTVFICAVISDPFGSADVTSANISITDPNGTVQLSGAAMTLNGGGGKDCSGNTNAAVNSYDYSYTLPIGGATGFWTATVTGHEGTEGTVTHTANGSFDVDVPSLLVMKSVNVVSSTLKAIPGQQMQYTILVQNNGRGTADSNSLVITDAIPTSTAQFYYNPPTPYTFTNNSAVTGLTGVTIAYSNTNGSTYTYTPLCTPTPCADSATTNIKFTLAGAMNGKTGATAPSFTISFNVVIQ